MTENRQPEAERAYIVARERAEKLGAHELPMAITLNHIGHQHQILGRLREAERAYAAALAIVERKLGPASHTAVRLAIDLSNVYLELDEVSRAESWVRRFLRRNSEPSSNDRAILLADLASVLASKGKFEDAEPLYRQALSFFERDPSQEFHERPIIALSNLSTIYMRMERFAEGRMYSDWARALLGTMTNPPPLLVFKTMANAAAISALSGQSEEADSLFQFAISLCENTFGPNYYLLGRVMNTYSQFLRKVRRGADARKAEKRAKAILDSFGKENLLGPTVDASAFR